MRDSVVFYRSWHEATKKLPPELYKEAMMAFMEYALNGSMGEISPVANLFLQMARPQVDANTQKYLNGCKGGRPPKVEMEEIESGRKYSDTARMVAQNQPETNKKPSTTKAEPNVYDNDKCLLKENTLKGVKEKRFTPPTVEQVMEYCQETGVTNVDAQRFVDFYTTKDWMIGKNRMKDWQAAVRNWARQDDKPKEHGFKTKKPNGFLNFEQRNTNYDEILLKQTQNWLNSVQNPPS